MEHEMSYNHPTCPYCEAASPEDEAEFLTVPTQTWFDATCSNCNITYRAYWWAAWERDKQRPEQTQAEAGRLEWNRLRKTRKAQLLAEGWAEMCQKCGARDDITIDHIKPLSKGGKSDLDNLRFLCRSCNSRKGAKIERRPSEDLFGGN